MEIHIPADFTLGELRAFIEGEGETPPEGYYTAQEWADHFGIDVSNCRRLLNRAKKRDILDTRHATRETLDGREYKVPIYALKSVEEGKDEK